MIRKTSQTSLKGEQAGETSYEFFDIHSDKTNLSGLGIYIAGSEDVAAWCEVDGKEGKFYVNKALRIENEQMILGNLADHCKIKYPEVTFTEFERADLMDV